MPTSPNVRISSSCSVLAEGQVPYEAGSGANNYVYFVSAYLGGPCSQLPFVTPGQVKAARQIKKFLTGKLEAQVSTYPAFPGKGTAGSGTAPLPPPPALLATCSPRPLLFTPPSLAILTLGGIQRRNLSTFIAPHKDACFSPSDPFFSPRDKDAACSDSHFLSPPPSPSAGTEANFLRAQIARISASTVCSPAGAFSANEEGGLDKNEEWEGVPGREAAQAASWAHRCVCGGGRGEGHAAAASWAHRCVGGRRGACCCCMGQARSEEGGRRGHAAWGKHAVRRGEERALCMGRALIGPKRLCTR